jgi:ATP-binding cassette subfamily C protein
VLSTRWEYFLHQPIGRLANSMGTEALRASQAYINGALVIALLIQTAIYTGVALLVSWQATLTGLGAGAVILSLSHFLVKMSKRAGKSQTKLLISLLARLTDTLQSVKPLKAMARENLADGVLEGETNKLNRALQREAFSGAALESAQEPMLAVVISAGIYVALIYWKMPLATVMVLVLVLAKVLTHMGKVQKQVQKMVIGESAFWSLQTTIQEAEQARESSVGMVCPRLETGIRLDRIRFAYGGDKPVLKNLSLEIPANSLTTLVGVSGAGKTTVIDLIAGLVRPQSGEIFIDNVPLDKVDLRKWRRKIGYVPQENLLLHDTVFNNVTLGDPELDVQNAEYALRAAGAWDFVANLPEGIYSVVGERGTKLSGGQRQRIMIARALVHRPCFLILDEATSALDPQSEAAISDTLEQLRGELTILAVSHQPAMIKAADRVYRLQNGVASLGSNGRVLSTLST